MARNRTITTVIGKAKRNARILAKAIGSLTTRHGQAPRTSTIESLEGRTLFSVPNGAYNAVAGASLTGINVTWTDNSWDEKGFVVERRAWGGAYAQVGTVGANGTSFWDSNVSSQTQYTYRVTAFNDSGTASPTESNNVVTNNLLNSTPAVFAAPAISVAAAVTSNSQLASPSNLATFATSSNSIALSWANAASGTEAGYKIERRTWGGAYSCIATVGQGVTSYTDSANSGGVAASTQYTYRVRAFNWIGDSDYSNESTVATPSAGGVPTNIVNTVDTVRVVPVQPTTAAGLPTPPSGLLTNATSATTVALSWTSNSGGAEAGFKIERKTWSGAYACIATVGAGVTSYTDTAYSGGVTGGTGYTYRIRAYNSVGDSGYSAESTATTPGASTLQAIVTNIVAQVVTAAGMPAAPSNLATAATSQTSVALSWASNTSGSEAGFKIERRTGGGAYAAIATVGAGVTTFTDTAYSGGVTAGTQYTYRVRAFNWVGDSAYSAESTVSTPSSAFQANIVVNTSSTWNPTDTTGYFTIGVYRQPVQSLAGWKARGINTVVAFYDNPTWMEEYINTSNALGLWQIRNPRQNIQADVGAQYLLAYSHPDEPDINGISTPFLAAEYAQWKAANPAVPVLVNVSGGDVLRPTYPANKDATYQGIFNTSDWITSDVYPVTSWAHPQWIDKASVLVNNGTDPYFSTIPFNNGLAVDKIRQLTGGKKQFSYIETSFQNNSSGPSIGGRVVTPDEFRGESWDAIIHGSKGLIYFPQAFNPDVTDATPPQIVAEMTRTDALVTSFGAALSSGSDANNNYVNLPGGLEATYRDFGGHRYYFVLNDSHGIAYNQTLNLPGLPSGAVEVAGEGRSRLRQRKRDHGFIHAIPVACVSRVIDRECLNIFPEGTPFSSRNARAFGNRIKSNDFRGTGFQLVFAIQTLRRSLKPSSFTHGPSNTGWKPVPQST